MHAASHVPSAACIWILLIPYSIPGKSIVTVRPTPRPNLPKGNGYGPYWVANIVNAVGNSVLPTRSISAAFCGLSNRTSGCPLLPLKD